MVVGCEEGKNEVTSGTGTFIVVLLPSAAPAFSAASMVYGTPTLPCKGTSSVHFTRYFKKEKKSRRKKRREDCCQPPSPTSRLPSSCRSMPELVFQVASWSAWETG